MKRFIVTRSRAGHGSNGFNISQFAVRTILVMEHQLFKHFKKPFTKHYTSMLLNCCRSSILWSHHASAENALQSVTVCLKKVKLLNIFLFLWSLSTKCTKMPKDGLGGKQNPWWACMWDPLEYKRSVAH